MDTTSTREDLKAAFLRNKISIKMIKIFYFQQKVCCSLAFAIDFFTFLWCNNKDFNSEVFMICYKKLWKLLIDKDMGKYEMIKLAGLSPYTLNKLNHNDNVNVETLAKICKALDCTFDDIMEIIHEEK